MDAKVIPHGCSKRLDSIVIAVAVCALGRALDFATTWVAIGQRRAAEGQPLAMHVFHLLGQHAGMIAYEALVTTPAIFLGCRLAARAFCRGSRGGPVNTTATSGEWLFFILIGVISLGAAVFNAQYLL